ncbi:MAG: hypothetical protein CSA26_08925 [Desulfobacterales bacterium]|nr:MAG: hypothetical protein CSA26_08925 [Desulfobacterales bacterium]
MQLSTRIGSACSHCGHFINLNELSRTFSASLVDKGFKFTGKCPACEENLSIRAFPEKPVRKKDAKLRHLQRNRQATGRHTKWWAGS